MHHHLHSLGEDVAIKIITKKKLGASLLPKDKDTSEKDTKMWREVCCCTRLGVWVVEIDCPATDNWESDLT